MGSVPDMLLNFERTPPPRRSTVDSRQSTARTDGANKQDVLIFHRIS